MVQKICAYPSFNPRVEGTSECRLDVAACRTVSWHLGTLPLLRLVHGRRGIWRVLRSDECEVDGIRITPPSLARAPKGRAGDSDMSSGAVRVRNVTGSGFSPAIAIWFHWYMKVFTSGRLHLIRSKTVYQYCA
jgi:hypothetical protein